MALLPDFILPVVFQPCHRCHGSGYTTCVSCHGMGRVSDTDSGGDYMEGNLVR